MKHIARILSGFCDRCRFVTETLQGGCVLKRLVGWVWLEVFGYQGRSKQDFSTSCGCRAGSKFAGMDKKFQLVQDSNFATWKTAT